MNAPFKENYLGQKQVNSRRPRILVAPLDWGLGHATRCVPLIYELLKQECEVWLAGEGGQQALLSAEFPSLHFLSLQGYRVKYPRSGSKAGMVWSIFRQVPKINSAIKRENAWLKQAVQEHRFDAVISDNRYGLYHPGIPCIFITHQLNIKSSIGKWMERILQRKNYSHINRFAACWVPDEKEKENSLAGELSHPVNKPAIPVHYAGLLSRFKIDRSLPTIEVKKDHLLVMLSGPEPQRTRLENKIVSDIAHYGGSATVVRGLPAATTIIPSTNSIRFYNHLSTEELKTEMLQAEYIICRSGYSSIMDIMRLRKKSILIPTPGQTEQEWLAQYLMEKKWALSVEQRNFRLDSVLSSARSYQYELPSFNGDNKLAVLVTQLLGSLS